MLLPEALSLLLRDQPLIGQPVHCTPPGTHVAERAPRRRQVLLPLEYLIPEPPERALAVERPFQPLPDPLVRDCLSEIGHVAVPPPRGQRLDAHQVRIELLQVNGVVPVDP